MKQSIIVRPSQGCNIKSLYAQDHPLSGLHKVGASHPNQAPQGSRRRPLSVLLILNRFSQSLTWKYRIDTVGNALYCRPEGRVGCDVSHHSPTRRATTIVTKTASTTNHKPAKTMPTSSTFRRCWRVKDPVSPRVYHDSAESKAPLYTRGAKNGKTDKTHIA